jgi:5,10-methylenetetrahydromethanopterin reductase
MTRPVFGVALQGNKRPAEYVALAQAIDAYRFEVVSVYNDLLFQPALGPLLWMAPHLHHARRIGPAALNPYLVHPVEIAGQAAVLDLATDGRGYLGLARGAWLDRLGVAQRRPISTLREAVLLIRHLLAGVREPFCGQIFRQPADTVLQYERVRPSVPITIGAWGRRMAHVAGAVADEIKVGGSANPAMVRRLRPVLDEGSRQAGRAAGSVGICLGAVTVVDADREVARGLARREVALYLTVVAELDPQTDPEWLARVRAASGRRDLDAIARDISDEVLERFAFAGSPRDLVHQIETIAAAGATRIELGTPLGLNPPDAIRLLGQQVLPAFRPVPLEAR